MTDCSSPTWILTATTVVSVLWAVANEFLASRKGDRNKKIVCVGDCFRNLTHSENEVTLPTTTVVTGRPSWWRGTPTEK
jgi:hypothetical protein